MNNDISQIERAIINKRFFERVAKAQKSGFKRKPLIQYEKIKSLKAEGLKQTEVAENLGIGIATVRRYWNKVD